MNDGPRRNPGYRSSNSIHRSMNYSKIYTDICERAKSRILTGYKERHHVIPECMGGSNDKENLVDLTAEEHFVAHQLLVRMYPSNFKLVFALNRMSGQGAKQQSRNNKRYGWIRKEFSAAISAANLGRKYPNRKPMSEAQLEKLRLAPLGKKQSPEHVAKRMASLARNRELKHGIFEL